MKHFIWVLCCLAVAAAGNTFAQTYAEEPEILIEMRGEQSAPVKTVSIWDKNALQLTQQFRGKDRAYVLYSVENVSTKDAVLQADNSKKYAFVRYGTDDGDYRKFLFNAEDPQTFVACAANLKDVLAVNLKYGVNMGVHLKDFLSVFGRTTAATELTDAASGKTLLVHKQIYSDINHKTPSPYYFIFDGNDLILTLAGDKAYQEYANNLETASQNSRKQTLSAQEKSSREKGKKPQASRQQNRRRPIKALAYGGTTEDQMYMPRVNNPKFPPPQPSKIPAGTPLSVGSF